MNEPLSPDAIVILLRCSRADRDLDRAETALSQGLTREVGSRIGAARNALMDIRVLAGAMKREER